MRVLDDMCDMLEDELKQIVKKDDINPQELDSAYKAVDILKDIETIKAMQRSEYSNEYSQRMPYSYDDYSMNYANNYGGSNNYNSNRSYARGGRDGDNDGRYNESRDRGYSRHDDREHLMNKIEELERKVGKMN